MLIRHLCYCLRDSINVAARQQDCDADRIVRCLKGISFTGSSSIEVDGTKLSLQDSEGEKFLSRLWRALGQFYERTAPSSIAIVPIPNQEGVIGAPANYRTLRYAQAIAANSSGRLIAIDALRWNASGNGAYPRNGNRDPELRYQNLVVTSCPTLPVLLFDDTIFTGSSFIAANWLLQEVGNSPQWGHVVARRTVIPQTDMLKAEERILHIPPHPAKGA